MIEGYTVRQIPPKQTHDWLLRKHYAHRIPSIMYSFGLYSENILAGICCFGNPANKNLNEIIEGYPAIELQRLVINDGLSKNSASYFIARSIKGLPSPMVIVSYSDIGQGHYGYIYQASNWLYMGETVGDTEFEVNGIVLHRKAIFGRLGSGSKENAIKHGYNPIAVSGKHRYLFLHGNRREIKEMKGRLTWPTFPYPKGDNQRYDASYEPPVQMVLV